MTREEFKRFEKANKIIEEIDGISNLVKEMMSGTDVEIHICEPYRKDYYFSNKTKLGMSIINSIKEAMDNYVKNLEDEFEKL